ncbi:MAG: aminodeoxychorismate/anthranilate synthase component II [Spirochaetales bacterium]|uniref:Aminodeoxychorismate/anthranilate synthase component II n=1 Tax=Candidatus Thalassospirochaeta sargassi TaxID=3119039 RepID=A0AAJ1IG32_9SPIO|nr:aminodeoxychorismate/anthranilate synthase component II [Spirochaetales bacterium]
MFGSDKTVIIDFNDSFTYNIYELLRRTGCRNFSVQPVDELDAAGFEIPGRIILSPGPGLPEDYPEVFRLLEKLPEYLPVLGICLGHQVIWRFFGGRLYNLKEVMHGSSSLIKLNAYAERQTAHSLYARCPETFTVGLYHSWAASKPVPEELLVTAESDRGVIMSASHKTRPVHGIQFHPESFISEYGEQILTNFLDL